MFPPKWLAATLAVMATAGGVNLADAQTPAPSAASPVLATPVNPPKLRSSTPASLQKRATKASTPSNETSDKYRRALINGGRAVDLPLASTTPGPVAGNNGLYVVETPGKLGLLGQNLVSLDTDHTEPSEAMINLLRSAGVNYVIGGDIKGGRRITARFRQVSLQEALDALSVASGVTYAFQGNIIILAPNDAQVNWSALQNYGRTYSTVPGSRVEGRVGIGGFGGGYDPSVSILQGEDPNGTEGFGTSVPVAPSPEALPHSPSSGGGGLDSYGAMPPSVPGSFGGGLGGGTSGSGIGGGFGGGRGVSGGISNGGSFGGGSSSGAGLGNGGLGGGATRSDNAPAPAAIPGFVANLGAKPELEANRNRMSYIMPLQNVDARQVTTRLSDSLPKGLDSVEPMERTNSLLLIGSKEAVDALIPRVKKMDAAPSTTPIMLKMSLFDEPGRLPQTWFRNSSKLDEAVGAVLMTIVPAADLDDLVQKVNASGGHLTARPVIMTLDQRPAEIHLGRSDKWRMLSEEKGDKPRLQLSDATALRDTGFIPQSQPESPLAPTADAPDEEAIRVLPQLNADGSIQVTLNFQTFAQQPNAPVQSPELALPKGATRGKETSFLEVGSSAVKRLNPGEVLAVLRRVPSSDKRDRRLLLLSPSLIKDPTSEKAALMKNPPLPVPSTSTTVPTPN